MRKERRRAIEHVKWRYNNPTAPISLRQVSERMKKIWRSQELYFTTQSNKVSEVLTFESVKKAVEAMKVAQENAPTHIEVFNIKSFLAPFPEINHSIYRRFNSIWGLQVVESDKVKPGTYEMHYANGRKEIFNA